MGTLGPRPPATPLTNRLDTGQTSHLGVKKGQTQFWM